MNKEQVVPTNTTPDQHQPTPDQPQSEGLHTGNQESTGEKKPNKFEVLLGGTAIRAVDETPRAPGTPPKEGEPGSRTNPVVQEGESSRVGLASMKTGASMSGVLVSGTVAYGPLAKPTQQPKG